METENPVESYFGSEFPASKFSFFSSGQYMGEHGQLDFFRERSSNVAMVINVWRESPKIVSYTTLFCALSESHSTTNGRIATWMRALTPTMTPLLFTSQVLRPQPPRSTS